MLRGGRNDLFVLIPNLRFEAQSIPKAEEAMQFRRRITMTSRVLRNFLLLPFALAVCASLGLAQSGDITRIEQNDPSIIYSGNCIVSCLFTLAATGSVGLDVMLRSRGSCL